MNNDNVISGIKNRATVGNKQQKRDVVNAPVRVRPTVYVYY